MGRETDELATGRYGMGVESIKYLAIRLDSDGLTTNKLCLEDGLTNVLTIKNETRSRQP